jgi:hypothetical protein
MLNCNMQHWMANVKVLCMYSIQCSTNQSSSRDTNSLQSLDLPLTFQDSRRRSRDGTISIIVFHTGASVADGLKTDRPRSRGNRNTDTIISRPPSTGGITPVPERSVVHKIRGVQTHHSSWHSCEQETQMLLV